LIIAAFFIREVDGWARLSMNGKADSLNVAVAGGVLMYFWQQENRTE
jgi:tRNA G18 (ribose-2'-O)-methylase SpoU